MKHRPALRPVSALPGHRNVAVVTLFDTWQKENSAGHFVLEKRILMWTPFHATVIGSNIAAD